MDLSSRMPRCGKWQSHKVAAKQKSEQFRDLWRRASGVTVAVQTWEEQLFKRVQGRVMVLGVGNELRGDDGVGPAVAQALADELGPAQRGRVIDCGDVPENYIGPILAAGADVIVLCDAADFGGAPGEVRIIEFGGQPAAAISTHNASLGLLVKVLRASAPVDVLLVAIQPQGTQFGAPLSKPVRVSAAEVTAVLAGLFKQ